MKDRVVIIGSVLSALAASICCIGPLVLVGLSMGGLAVSTLLAPWRPYLLSLTFGLLALGFYLAYRRPKAACAGGAVCASSPATPGRRNKLLLWTATFLVVLLAAFPYYSGRLSAAFHLGAGPVARGTAIDVPTGHSAKVTIKVSGMTCSGCAEALKRALERTPGVESADVRFERSNAVVEYNAARVTLDQITQVIRQAGYRPSL